MTKSREKKKFKRNELLCFCYYSHSKKARQMCSDLRRSQGMRRRIGIGRDWGRDRVWEGGRREEEREVGN